MRATYRLSEPAAQTMREVRADIASCERTDPLNIPLSRVALRLVRMAPDMARFQAMARAGQASGQMGYNASRFAAAARELTRGEG